MKKSSSLIRQTGPGRTFEIYESNLVYRVVFFLEIHRPGDAVLIG